MLPNGNDIICNILKTWKPTYIQNDARYIHMTLNKFVDVKPRTEIIKFR